MAINHFLMRHGIMFTHLRDDSELVPIKGLVNREQSSNRNYVGFLPADDVQVGDQLINDAGEVLIVEDVVTAYFQGRPHEKRAFTLTKVEWDRKNKSSTSQFNVQNAYGSIIGNQTGFTFNYQTSINEMRKSIDSVETADREELQKLIDLLEQIVEGSVPIRKGVFSRFSEVMERNSWITGSIAATIMNLLASQVI